MGIFLCNCCWCVIVSLFLSLSSTWYRVTRPISGSGFKCIFEEIQRVSEVISWNTSLLFASMADLKTDTLRTYAYLLIYIALSSGQIFFNKVIANHFKLMHCLLRLLPVKKAKMLFRSISRRSLRADLEARIRCSVCVFLF